jgi:hypothetical protein
MASLCSMNRPRSRKVRSSKWSSVRFPIWIDLMKAADKLVWAGLSREAGPESLHDAYRRWCAEYFERRSARLVALASKLRAAGE